MDEGRKPEGDTLGGSSSGPEAANQAAGGSNTTNQQYSGSDIPASLAALLSSISPRQTPSLGSREAGEQETGPAIAGTSGSNPGSNSKGLEAGKERQGASSYPPSERDLERIKRAGRVAQAHKWLKNGTDGKQELLEEIRLNLAIDYQIEVEEGQNIRDTREGPAQARQSRKQAKEIAELIMETIDLKVVK